MHSDDSKPTFISITGGLLGACLLILFGLAWQAIQATRAHYAISHNVLREYAVIIANEYSRRITQDIGYSGYYALISEIQEQVQRSGLQVLEPLSNKQNDTLAEHLILFENQQVSIVKEGQFVTERPELQRLKKALYQSFMPLDQSVLEKRPFHAIHVMGRSPHTVIFTQFKQSIIGFVVNKVVLKQHLEKSADRAPLFPESLANGKLTNAFIGVSVHLLDGSRLAQLGYSAEPLVNKVMEEEYGSIFKGMTIQISIDPAISQALLMGERPMLRLPLILVAFFVAAALLLIAIRQMKTERALVSLRNRFIAEASHELRTPLAQIRLFAETLMLNRVQDERAQKKALSIINREAQRLGYLVNNILSFSQKTKHRQLVLEQTCLGDIVTDAADELELAAAQLDCSFNLEIQDVSCRIDAAALHQILINLLDNALKYGGKKQLITVRVRKTSEAAVIYVIDQGTGVPDEEREKIWQDFYRPSTHNETGVGIGLSIVRELTTQMKGQCYLEPMDVGACFVLSFPLEDNMGPYGASEGML
jgi:signal transduction histidine kinase